MSPVRDKDKGHAKNPLSDEEASKLIAMRIQQANVRIELPEAEERCSNCGAKVRNMPLSGVTIHIEIE